MSILADILLFFSSIFLGTWWVAVFSAAYLVFWALYFRKQVRASAFKKFFITLTAFLLVRAVFETVATYFVWKSATPSMYFLPPYQPLSYFLHYSLTHYGMTFLLTALFTGVFGFVLWFAGVKILHGKLWMRGEEYIFLSGAFLVRWPLVIPYLFAGLLLSFVAVLLFSAVEQFFLRSNIRTEVSLALWYPLATVFLLLFQEKVIHILALSSLVMPG